MVFKVAGIFQCPAQKYQDRFELDFALTLFMKLNPDKTEVIVVGRPLDLAGIGTPILLTGYNLPLYLRVSGLGYFWLFCCSWVFGQQCGCEHLSPAYGKAMTFFSDSVLATIIHVFKARLLCFALWGFP